MVGISICYPLSEGYLMGGFFVKWYNREGNFDGVAIDGVAIVIAAAAIVIVAG